MKRYVIINDSDLTQEMLNLTGKFNTDYLRWNQNKSIVTPKKYILSLSGSIPEVLMSYYLYNSAEILEVLTESEWQDVE